MTDHPPAFFNMEKKLLAYNPETDTTQIFHWDPATNSAVIETIQPLDNVIEANQEDYADSSAQTPYGEGIGSMVARIPTVIYDRLLASGMVHDRKAMAKFLNDRDNLKFRTRPGRL